MPSSTASAHGQPQRIHLAWIVLLALPALLAGTTASAQEIPPPLRPTPPQPSAVVPPQDTTVRSASRFVVVAAGTAMFDSTGARVLNTNPATDTVLVWRATAAPVIGGLYLVFVSPDSAVYLSGLSVRGRQVAPSAALLREFASLLGSLPVEEPDLDPLVTVPVSLQVADIQEERAAINFGLEHSYVTLTQGLGDEIKTLFEANLAAHVVLDPAAVSASPWPVIAVFTYKTVLRQYVEASLPVRTPNYMPRATLYYWGPPFRRSAAEAARFGYAALTFSHFSNGQNGSFLDTLSGRHNYENGDFSTNFFEATVTWAARRPTLFSQSSVAIRVHPFTGEHPVFRRTYGVVRATGTTQLLISEFFRWLPLGLHTAAVSATYLMGPMGDQATAADRVNVAATLYFQHQRVHDLWWFLSFYEGQDYYNIRYDRHMRVLRAGLAARLTAQVFEPN